MKTILLLAAIIAMNCGPAVFRAKCQATNAVKAAEDDLPPDMQRDMFLQDAKKFYDQGAWGQAIPLYEKAFALKVEPAVPAEARWEYAQAMYNSCCDVGLALPAIKQYLKTAGRDGKHYADALSLLSRTSDESKEYQKSLKYQAVWDKLQLDYGVFLTKHSFTKFNSTYRIADLKCNHATIKEYDSKISMRSECTFFCIKSSQ